MTWTQLLQSLSVPLGAAVLVLLVVALEDRFGRRRERHHPGE